MRALDHHDEAAEYLEGFLSELRDKGRRGRTRFRVQVIDAGLPPEDREKLR